MENYKATLQSIIKLLEIRIAKCEIKGMQSEKRELIHILQAIKNCLGKAGNYAKESKNDSR